MRHWKINPTPAGSTNSDPSFNRVETLVPPLISMSNDAIIGETKTPRRFPSTAFTAAIDSSPPECDVNRIHVEVVVGCKS